MRFNKLMFSTAACFCILLSVGHSFAADPIRISCCLIEGVMPDPDLVAFRNDGSVLSNINVVVTFTGRNGKTASKQLRVKTWQPGGIERLTFSGDETVIDIQTVKLSGRCSTGNIDDQWNAHELAQTRLRALDHEIREKEAEVNRMVFAPVIPGRVDIVPGSNPLADTYQVKRGPSIYAGSDTNRLNRLQGEIKQLRQEYDSLKKRMQSSGIAIDAMAKCERCHGYGQIYGPHYELGRKPDDGELGMVFQTGGWHQCPVCQGKGAK